MIYTVNTTPIGIYPMPDRNTGIVPPWLTKPPVFTLPVEPAGIRVLVGSVPVGVGAPLLGASS